MYTIGIYLLLNCCYLLFFALAGLKKVRPLTVKVTKHRRICILIPAYRADQVIAATARSAIKHRYPGTVDVFVIADRLRSTTVEKLKENGAGVIEVSFKRSTKAKALAASLSFLENHYDIVMVLDADNIMDENVLEEINAAFEAGYRAVQTHRTAKNSNTPFSFLDACNEEINNHIYRQGPFALGLSSALIGSGMAFEYEYFKKIIANMGEIVGEDKEMDFRIAKDKVKIAYLRDTYVFDEKIDNAKVFTRQRARWMSSQLEVLKKYSKETLSQLRNGNVEFINKLIQAWLVPRTLLIAALGMFFLLSLFISAGPPTIFWIALLLLLFASLLLSVPRHLYKNKMLGQAIFQLPYAVLCMVGALFGIHKTRHSYMATPHKRVVSSKINS